MKKLLFCLLLLNYFCFSADLKIDSKIQLNIQAIEQSILFISETLQSLMKNFLGVHKLIVSQLVNKKNNENLLIKIFENYERKLALIADQLNLDLSILFSSENLPKEAIVSIDLHHNAFSEDGIHLLEHIIKIIKFDNSRILEKLNDEGQKEKIRLIKRRLEAKIEEINKILNALKAKLAEFNSENEFDDIDKHLDIALNEAFSGLVDEQEGSNTKNLESKTKSSERQIFKQNKVNLYDPAFNNEKNENTAVKQNKKKKIKNKKSKQKNLKASAAIAASYAINQQAHPVQESQKNEDSSKKEKEEKLSQEFVEQIFDDLFEAITKNDTAFVSGLIKLIKEKYLDINKLHRGTTALHIAAQKGNLEFVMLLLNAGAEACVYDEGGYTALHIAVSNNFKVMKENSDFTKMAKAMIDNQWSNGPFSNKAYDMLTFNTCRSILHLACNHGNLDTVKLCVAYCNVHNIDNDGNQAIHSAACSTNAAIIEELVKHHSQVNAQNKQDNTPLHIACTCGDENLEVVKCLVEHKANVNAINSKRFTPAQIAGKFGCSKILRYLADHGADLEKQSPEQKSAIEYHNELVHLFHENNWTPKQFNKYLNNLHCNKSLVL